MAKKLRPKELKQPDQFVGFWTRAWMSVGDFAAGHTKALVIGMSTLATVIVGSIVIAQVSERRAVAASGALGRVQRIATASLTPPATGAPPAPPPPSDGLPHFATEKERVEAALKELDGYFSSKRVPLHDEAMLVRAGLLLDLGRADEALEHYKKLLDGRVDDRLRFLATEGLGYAYERKGNLAEAASMFTKLGGGGGAWASFYKDRALYHQARVAELKGNQADAVRLYKEVLEKHPTTSLRDEVTNRVAQLELK